MRFLFFGHAAQHAELPQPGIKPVLPALEVWSLDHQGSPPRDFFKHCVL